MFEVTLAGTNNIACMLQHACKSQTVYASI